MEFQKNQMCSSRVRIGKSPARNFTLRLGKRFFYQYYLPNGTVFLMRKLGLTDSEIEIVKE